MGPTWGHDTELPTLTSRDVDPGWSAPPPLLVLLLARSDPAGELVCHTLAGHDGEVRTWDPTTGTALTSLRVPGSLSHLALASTTIAAAGERGPYFLTLHTGTPTRTRSRRSSSVNEDGRRFP